MIEINSTHRAIFSDEKTELKKIFSNSLAQINEQFEDHLTAINENTHETQAIYEYLAEMDSKINKMAERMEKIQLFLEQKTHCLVEAKTEFSPKQLTKREKEIFMALSCLENEKGMVTSEDISRRTVLPEILVDECISAMAAKDVPIIKSMVNKRIYLRIDPSFKSVQQHTNILQIEQTTLRVDSVGSIA